MTLATLFLGVDYPVQPDKGPLNCINDMSLPRWRS